MICAKHIYPSSLPFPGQPVDIPFVVVHHSNKQLGD